MCRFKTRFNPIGLPGVVDSVTIEGKDNQVREEAARLCERFADIYTKTVPDEDSKTRNYDTANQYYTTYYDEVMGALVIYAKNERLASIDAKEAAIAMQHVRACFPTLVPSKAMEIVERSWLRPYVSLVLRMIRMRFSIKQSKCVMYKKDKWIVQGIVDDEVKKIEEYIREIEGMYGF